MYIWVRSVSRLTAFHKQGAKFNLGETRWEGVSTGWEHDKQKDSWKRTLLGAMLA